MLIGIIVYSYTNNTMTVAERIRDALVVQGHIVHIERITAMNEDPKSREQVRLKHVPEVTAYEVVILGAPVKQLQLNPIMRAYLSQLPQLRDKKVACFVTQSLPQKWMGGSRAMKQMIRAIKRSGAITFDSGIVQWLADNREQQIVDVVARLRKI